MNTLKLILTILQLLSGLAVTVVVLLQSGKSAGLSGAIAGVYAVLRADLIDALNEAPAEEQRTRWRSMAFDATVTGVLLHAEAGRQVAKIHGTHGVLARETADMLGIVMQR